MADITTLPPVSGVSYQNNCQYGLKNVNSGVQPVNFGSNADSFTRTSVVTANPNQEKKSDMKKWLLFAGLGIAGVAAAIICKKKMDLSKAAKAAGFDDVSTYKKLLNDFPDTTIKKYETFDTESMRAFLKDSLKWKENGGAECFVVGNKITSDLKGLDSTKYKNLPDNSLLFFIKGPEGKWDKTGVVCFDNLSDDIKNALKPDGFFQVIP